MRLQDGPLFVDARGRDLTERRGVPPKLTDAQIEAAYRLHIEGGLSLRELGRRGWRQWGYASANSAAAVLCKTFKARGWKSRDRVEAIVLASTVHGKASRAMRVANDPVFSAHRQQQRRASGEVRGQRCVGVRLQYPDKGAPCKRPALAGSDYCLQHDPERRAEVLDRAEHARKAA